MIKFLFLCLMSSYQFYVVYVMHLCSKYVLQIPSMINFVLGVTSGFSEFSEFLFRTDRKTLSNCKIIDCTISTTIFMVF